MMAARYVFLLLLVYPFILWPSSKRRPSMVVFFRKRLVFACMVQPGGFFIESGWFSARRKEICHEKPIVGSV